MYKKFQLLKLVPPQRSWRRGVPLAPPPQAKEMPGEGGKY